MTKKKTPEEPGVFILLNTLERKLEAVLQLSVMQRSRERSRAVSGAVMSSEQWQPIAFRDWRQQGSVTLIQRRLHEYSCMPSLRRDDLFFSNKEESLDWKNRDSSSCKGIRYTNHLHVLPLSDTHGQFGLPMGFSNNGLRKENATICQKKLAL